MARLKALLYLSIHAALVFANVEKTIFTAPESITLPNISPVLGELCLEELSPIATKIRKFLPVIFLDNKRPLGKQSWYLVKDLVPGSRYEVRICWPASVGCPIYVYINELTLKQPTSFELNLFGLNQALFESEVIKELAVYANARQGPPCHGKSPQEVSTAGTQSSLMFLSIHAASDFFSSNQTLMKNPPDVLVDISKSKSGEEES
jgi:hypothetical protein